MRQVVHGYIATQGNVTAQGIELDPCQLAERESRGTRPARELRRTDQTLVFVGAARNESQDVLRADDREEKRLEVAVEGRDEQRSARSEEACEGRRHRSRIGNVLQHLHAGDHLELTGSGLRKLFG